jgi:6-phosphofructokinase 1
VDYVAAAVVRWPHGESSAHPYALPVATKATILGHTLRGAPPTPEDKAIAQHFAHEAVRRLVEKPDSVVGCMMATRDSTIGVIPLHAIQSKPFDWELFARMHGTDVSNA